MVQLNGEDIMSNEKMYDSRKIMIGKIWKKEGNKVTLTMEMIVSLYDYMMENGQVVRGKADTKAVMHYQLVFVFTLGNNGICPNCGAVLPKTNVCEYCHSVVPNSGSSWVMAKKQVLRQK